MREGMWRLSFWSWLALLNIITSSCIHCLETLTELRSSLWLESFSCAHTPHFLCPLLCWLALLSSLTVIWITVASQQLEQLGWNALVYHQRRAMPLSLLMFPLLPLPPPFSSTHSLLSHLTSEPLLIFKTQSCSLWWLPTFFSWDSGSPLFSSVKTLWTPRRNALSTCPHHAGRS